MAVMTTPLTGSSLVTAGSVQPAGQNVARARSNAAAYANAMREAGAPEAPVKTIAVSGNQPARADHSREAPFGAERPRLLRPGSILDIRV
jgi:hypothetical protein